MTIGKPWAIALFVVLFLSLAANLIVAGFATARFHGPPRGGSGFIERIVAIGIRAFPAEIQADIRQRADSERELLRERVEAVQQARLRMLEAMRAEPFDAEALDAAFAEVRQRVAEMQEAGQRIVGDAVAVAPPGERIKIRMRRGPFP
jgi:uncharacterized membrane protein